MRANKGCDLKGVWERRLHRWALSLCPVHVRIFLSFRKSRLVEEDVWPRPGLGVRDTIYTQLVTRPSVLDCSCELDRTPCGGSAAGWEYIRTTFTGVSNRNVLHVLFVSDEVMFWR